MSSFLVPRQNPAFGHLEAKDSLVSDGLFDVYNKFPMGNCAEHTAAQHNISRDEQDDHCLSSYERAENSWKNGLFDEEIAPVTVKTRKGDVVVKEDEEYKKLLKEKYRGLKPVFKKDGGTVTAANASTLNDGASAVVLVGGDVVEKEGLKPLAKILGESSPCTARFLLTLIRLRRCCMCSHRLPDCANACRPQGSQGCRCDAR